MGQGYFSALEKTRKRKNSKTIPSKYSINHLMRLKDNIMNNLDNLIFLDDVPIKSKQKEDDKMVMNNTCQIVNRSRCCDKCNTMKDENNYKNDCIICEKCLIQMIKENNEEK